MKQAERKAEETRAAAAKTDKAVVIDVYTSTYIYIYKYLDAFIKIMFMYI